jgi:nucleotide-binding universal stress UspA family protein
MVRILAATDFSEESRPVLEFAANMVRQCGGKMYLLHAVEPCVIDAAGSISACDIPDGIPGIELPRVGIGCEVLEMADNRAKELAAEISRKWDIPIYGKAEEADDIVSCMNAFCKRHNIDILVIGNRHHSLLTSILLGNTAEKIIRSATIPVTVVPCATSK